jgi:hypothetical protein
MGFRASIGLADVDGGSHYGSILAGRPVKAARPEPYDQPSVLGPARPRVEPDLPFRLGYGPVACSSRTTLVLMPEVCFDVNGYYRALGVHWRASRKELMRAYWERDGQDSHYLTYVLHQLLNPFTRRAYDCMALGEIFFDDLVTEALNQKAKREAYRRSQSGGIYIEKDEVLKDWGYVSGNDLVQQEALDAAAEINHDEDRQGSWGYSYYLWRTMKADPSLMKVWQIALISALSALSYSLTFGVGMAGKLEVPFVVYEGKEGKVVFLNADHDPEERTIEELAGRAARQLLEM